jgi:Holliday junction resolvase RusA-like endonuclease
VEKKKYILHITPQTNVRATQGDRIFFRIPREKLYPSGLARLKRLEKYNDYKIALRAEARRVNFELPEQGAFIKFFIPMPKSWRKFKRQAMHFKLHQQRKDIDNMIKGFFDGLLVEDKHIAHIEAAKFWVDFPVGWIDITISEPKYDSLEIPKSLKDLLTQSTQDAE